MITNEQQLILDALQSALRANLDGMSKWTAVTLDAEKIAAIIMNNGILLTVYPALSRFPALAEKLRDRYYSVLKQAILQQHAGNQILQKLADERLDCIALKGWELRKLYPESTMRQMTDLDILVRPYDFAVIQKVMNGLGFQGRNEESPWKHDSFSKDLVTVELHKRLTDDSDLIQAWEKTIWAHAEPLSPAGHIHRMSAEDYYIFHFVHLHKDFLNGSLGLRRIVDTWLLEHRAAVDMAAVRAVLERFHMWTFHERMVRLGRVTMGEADMDEASELLLQHSFLYGIYGSDKSYKAGRIAAMGESLKLGKLRSVLAAVFLPLGRMRAQFPVLNRYPLLLPFFWAKRILRYLAIDSKGSCKRLNYRDINDADYQEMKRFFAAGGISL